MSLNIYINFNGNCREAVEFYARVFQTEPPKILTFGEAHNDPNHPIPEEAKNRVMHTFLNISNGIIMFSDIFPGMTFIQGNNMSLTVQSDKVEDIKNWFSQLKEGGTVSMDLQETFWSKCYGMIIDQFGIHWQLSHQGEQL